MSTLDRYNEKRRSPRFDARYNVQFDGGSGVTHNLSSRGVYFETSSFIAVGSLLRLYIEMTDEQAEPVLMHVRVLRFDELAPSAFGVASRIERLAIVSREEVSAFDDSWTRRRRESLSSRKREVDH